MDQARRMGATPKVQKALIEAGIVESQLRNVHGGDRDSLGVLQQREMYTPRSVSLNPRKAAAKFIREAMAARNRYGSAGALAQGVQRSGYPDRYGKRAAEADQIIRSLGAGATTGRTATDGRAPKTLTLRTKSYEPGESRAPERAAALTEFFARPSQPGDMRLVRLVSALQSMPDTAGKTTEKRTELAMPSDTAGSGGGPIQSGGGWGGSQRVVRGAQQIAKAMGIPTSNTKRPGKLTKSGGISDHWTGNKQAFAADLSTRGAQGDQLYRKLARHFGLGPSGQWQSKIIKTPQGRYRVQVGWRVPDHFDHVHVGVMKQ